MLYYKKLAAVILFVTSYSVYASQENQQAIVSFDRFQLETSKKDQTETLKKDQTETLKKDQIETSKKYQFDEAKTTKRAHVKLEDQLAGYRELEKKRDVSVRYSAFFDNMPIEVMSMIVAANNVGERKVIPDLREGCSQQEIVATIRAQVAREEHQLVAVRDLRSLACVNKSLNKLVNDGQVVERFITSMADRDDVSKVNIAGLMQTKGAKVWLNNYADTSGEYETFKAAQAIITISKNICEQLHQHDFETGISYDYNQGCRPTKEGLILNINDYYSCLYTPWGAISLSTANADFLLKGFIAQKMFKQITAHIKEGEGLINDDIVALETILADSRNFFYEHKQEISLDSIKKSLSNKDYYLNFVQKIPLEKFVEKKGQNFLIMPYRYPFCNRYELSCLYKVHAVGNQQLPESQLASQKERKSYKVENVMWKLMNKKFEEEERIKLIKKQVLIELLAKNPNVIESSI